MTNAFFFALYSGWGVIWAHVLFYYAAFANREWRAAGGTWRKMPAELGRLLHFTFVPLWRDTLNLVRRQPLAPDGPLNYRYSKSHRMGFYIAVAAAMYAIMGLSFSIYPDRTGWPMLWIVLRTVLIAGTSLAGLGHLFTALEHRPRRWRLFVLCMLFWYPVAYCFYEIMSGHMRWEWMAILSH